MKRIIASLALLLLAALAFGQTPTGPQLGTYGNLVGLKDKNGKDVLSKKSGPWREGFAIAYRLQKPGGGADERLVYVIGDQPSSKSFVVDKNKSTNARKVFISEDKALQISRSVVWDDQSKSLITQLTITNVSKTVVNISGIEFQLDKELVADIVDPLCPAPDTCAECPLCGCGKRCKPEKAMVLNRNLNVSRPIFENDPFGGLLPPIDCRMRSFFWAAANIERATLNPGEDVSVSATTAIAGNILPN